MALTDNKIIRSKQSPLKTKVKLASGLIHVYKGAHLALNSGGYAVLASDALALKYAGIALEEVNLTAAVNSADGLFDVLVLRNESLEIVEMDVTSNITIANLEAAVYMDTDEKVDIGSGIAFSTTLGRVGVIKEFISTNKAWVQMT